MKQLILLATLVSTALIVSAQTEEADTANTKKERTIALWGHVYDAVTKAGVDNTFITLMREDSTVVDTVRAFNMGQWHATKPDVGYRFQIPAQPRKYIIRAEHEDYEPCYVDYEVKHVARNTFFDAPWHYLKKRPKNYDMLGDSIGLVTVRATRVKMVFRGDTIVYNADAFNLPEGSMLDALIRQLDGVELKDDGRILVNGKQIDELTLNGKDFFRGNNKVLLENLPHYTVDNVKVYHKTTELSEYLGYDTEKKRYVMDVILKREYAQGWLANVEVAGGTPFGEKDMDGKEFDKRFIARLFAMRYTDNSRLTFFANTNNVNESRKPGSNGEWAPSNMPTGQHTNRQAGVDLLVDDGQKRWKEMAQAELKWTESNSQSATSAEHFLANSGSTFSRSRDRQHARWLSLHVANQFELKKPFYLRSYTEMQYQKARRTSDALGMTATVDPSAWGSTLAALDSAFSLSLSVDKQNELVNRSQNRSRLRSHRLYGGSFAEMTYKLPTGDVVGFVLNGNVTRQRENARSLQRIDYLHEQDGNERQNRYTRRPEDDYHFYFSPNYTISWLNGFKLRGEYRYLQEGKNNRNDAYRLDWLSGPYAEGTWGVLPSTRDSLLLAIDATNTYERDHLRHEHRVIVTPQYKFDKNGRYVYLETLLEGYNVRERLHYVSAATDTTLRHNSYTFSPTVNALVATDNWKRYFSFYYNCEMKTPDLLSMVDVRNDENPLAVRRGNTNLKAPTIHRMQTSVSRNWDQHKTSLTVGYGLRFYLNQVSQGYTFNPATGVYTYMPMNVDGNWQTYFYNHFSRNIDRQGRLTLSNYAHGDYSRNVDYAARSDMQSDGSRLSHVNNYYLEDRLTLNYRLDDLTIGTQFYGQYRHATNQEHTIRTIDAYDYSYGVNATYNCKRETFAKIIRGFSLATDLKMYSRRGYGDTSLNRNDLVWNASLSRTFAHTLGGTLTARLEGFDLLHQLSNTMVVINGQGRTETVTNTLPRYLMLHLTYNFARSPRNRDKK